VRLTIAMYIINVYNYKKIFKYHSEDQGVDLRMGSQFAGGGGGGLDSTGSG
jgi:hypothetical protein